jgi:hypothetical protein
MLLAGTENDAVKREACAADAAAFRKLGVAVAYWTGVVPGVTADL